jgi:outer membrane murein-binding lipoprotein Lpp
VCDVVGVAITSATLALFVAGCGSAASLEQEVRTLRDEMTRLQNSQDRLEERLAQAENAAARQQSNVREADTDGTSEHARVPELFRPELKVVKLEPPAQPVATAAPSPEGQAGPDVEPARPLISGQGERIRAEFVEDGPAKAPARRRSGR